MENYGHGSVTEIEIGELVIVRIFDAPRAFVWKAWTDPHHLRRWWGPKDFTAPVCKMDLRIGGTYLFCMRSNEGQEFWSSGTYKEIVEQERIVYTDNFADENGNIVPASHYGIPGDWPEQLLVTITFENIDSLPNSNSIRTKMTLTHVGLPAGQIEGLTGAGWNESFDKLAESLK
jgi:uncharacterized protein YndB with AHSA1/START domain